MRRNEFKTGDHVALVTRSYGSTYVREVIVLSDLPWEQTFSHHETTEEVGGVTYTVRGYRRARNFKGNGVLVAHPHSTTATVAQLSQLQPLHVALEDERQRDETARAAEDRRRAVNKALEERATKALEALGIASSDWDRTHNRVSISIDALEALVLQFQAASYNPYCLCEEDPSDANV